MLARTLCFILAMGLAQAFTAGLSHAPVRGGNPLFRKRPVDIMKGKSKVVLTQDVASIKGKVNEVVTVRNGFLLNYLLPRGLAEKASDETLAKVAASIAEAKAAAAASLAEMTSLSAKLAGVSGVSIAKKVGENGAIFGSVSASELISAIESASGLTLGSPKVTFEAVSAVGSYSCSVQLHPQVSAEVSFEVTEESA